MKNIKALVIFAAVVLGALGAFAAPEVWADAEAAQAKSAQDAERVKIPSGYVVMGTDSSALKSQLGDKRTRPEWYMDETPQRKAVVKEFLIDSTEVTNERYKEPNPKHSYPENLKDHPVVNVTWEEADAFCKSAGGRLPTQAEWERAARGEDGRIYPWGNEFFAEYSIFMGTPGVDARLRVGSYSLEESASSLLGGTKSVGSREKGNSPFGIYDMAGNAWEWVDGWYDEDKNLRMLKGGSWLTPQASVRSAVRLGDDPNSRYNDYGFRCAYDSAPSSEGSEAGQ